MSHLVKGKAHLWPFGVFFFFFFIIKAYPKHSSKTSGLTVILNYMSAVPGARIYPTLHLTTFSHVRRMVGTRSKIVDKR